MDEDQARRATDQLLFALEQFAALGFRHEFQAEEGAFELQSEASCSLLDRAISVLGQLQLRYEPRESTARSCSSSEWFIEDAKSATGQAIAGPGVADVCFAATFELSGVRREIREANSAETRAAVTERAHRKLVRAARAVLDSARRSPERDQRPSDAYLADVEVGLAVRRLYATFRRALRRPVELNQPAVLDALRYAAGALSTLMTSPSYNDVRATDRVLLRHLRERVFAWSQRKGSLDEGLRVLDDVWTCADLLRGINHRQELRAHDLGLIRSLLHGPGADVARWCAQLDPLRGLDDVLDVRLDALVSVKDAEHVSGVVERLSQLA